MVEGFILNEIRQSSHQRCLRTKQGIKSEVERLLLFPVALTSIQTLTLMDRAISLVVRALARSSIRFHPSMHPSLLLMCHIFRAPVPRHLTSLLITWQTRLSMGTR